MKKSAKILYWPHYQFSGELSTEVERNQNSSRIQFGWYGQEVGRPNTSRTPKQMGD
jgi:hypothetical protein